MIRIFLPALLMLTMCNSMPVQHDAPLEDTSVDSDNRPIAFPGAEGYGKYTTGGRGGKVYIVNTLADSGPGSLREAATAKEPRIIVFAVAGTIHLVKPLTIEANATIAGQSAPGDGICIADRPVRLVGDNIIVRFLRIRLGDRLQNKGMVNKGGSEDAFTSNGNNNIIIDHCSMSWSTDEVCSVYNGDSTTLQWNIISEPLDYSYHFEDGDKDYEHHGFGSIIGGVHNSVHHNLYAHCAGRTPMFNGTRKSGSELVDFTNNVIYNWDHNNMYGGFGGNYNLVNNYYKYGPSTQEKHKSRLMHPYKNDKLPFGRFFIEGNYVDGDPKTTNDNWLGVKLRDGSEEDEKFARSGHEVERVSVHLQDAEAAYKDVLAKAGASKPVRDAVDSRVVEDVKNRTGKIIDVQGGFDHGTAYEVSSKAWPMLAAPKAMVPDTDADGMPDAWEDKNGLNKNDKTDASAYTLDKAYTNIEMYLNTLAVIQ